jgi:hypothetical protein
MRPFEEYFQRHKIKNVPIIKHAENGAVFLKNKNLKQSPEGAQYALLNFFWQHNNIHPGRYYVEVLLPVPNGHEKNRLFITYMEKNLKWHEYEDFWINYIKANSKDFEGIQDHDEAYLSAWSMFNCIFETFCDNLKVSHKRIFEESVNIKNFKNSRLRYCEDCEKILEDNYGKISYLWKNRFYRHLNHYSDWLAKLL